MFLNNKSPWLGQVALVLGPSSWGAGAGVPTGQPIAAPSSNGTPPYYAEWGVQGVRVGPFNTIQEAFKAAVEADAGEFKVKDSRGQSVGPIT